MTPQDEPTVEPLADAVAPTALAVLTEAETAAGVPLVDEAERVRLERLADTRARTNAWHPLVAHLGDEAVGYGALTLGGDSTAVGDVAVVPWARAAATVLQRLLERLAATAQAHGADHLQVWVRHVQDDTLRAATAAGFAPERRLGVLGRSLDDERPPVAAPPGVRVRPYAGEQDDEAVVAVLAAAYAGTDEAGWDLARFRERTGLPWFRPEDLLLAEDEDGAVRGIHWLKRRDADVGEVYNLAVHPDAQGLRLGPLLLHAGLDHLRAVGCAEVWLWVDLANEPAVRLYTSAGFATMWEDVALSRTVTGQTLPSR